MPSMLENSSMKPVADPSSERHYIVVGQNLQIALHIF
jgi:hypothetical protein